MRGACAGMTVRETRCWRPSLQNGRTKPFGEMPAISMTPCRRWICPLSVTTSARYRAPNPHCFHCFSHCSFHCFPLFLRRRLFRRSFKALHCNWRQFSIVDRLYFCTGRAGDQNSGCSGKPAEQNKAGTSNDFSGAPPRPARDQFWPNEPRAKSPAISMKPPELAVERVRGGAGETGQLPRRAKQS
jgi:hypothetical protein